uniref:helicase-related protein n=1 Tax=Xanthomonas fragariae TaxID=48664 RepID=UPI0018FF7845
SQRWIELLQQAQPEGGDNAPEIDQQFFEVDPTYRQKAVAGLLLRFNPESSVVFCNTRKEVDEVAGSLQEFGFSALALHGDMEQRDRDEVLVRFVNRSCNVLVASDVAARGLDVEDLSAVVNYELPTDTETYRHRIGRTARAGKRGLALSLVASRETGRAQALEAEQGQPLKWSRAPLATARPAQLPQAAMITLRIDGGKTDKLRAGDILGALTGEAGLSGAAIGKIAIYPTRSYVAIVRAHVDKALAHLHTGKIKGRRFRVNKL